MCTALCSASNAKPLTGRWSTPGGSSSRTDLNVLELFSTNRLQHFPKLAPLSNTCHTCIASENIETETGSQFSCLSSILQFSFLDCLPLWQEGALFKWAQSKVGTIMGRLKFARTGITSHISISRARNSFPNIRPGHLGQNGQGIGCILTCKTLHLTR